MPNSDFTGLSLSTTSLFIVYQLSLIGSAKEGMHVIVVIDRIRKIQKKKLLDMSYILFLDLFSSLSSLLITLYGSLNVYIYFFKHKEFMMALCFSDFPPELAGDRDRDSWWHSICKSSLHFSRVSGTSAIQSRGWSSKGGSASGYVHLWYRWPQWHRDS